MSTLKVIADSETFQTTYFYNADSTLASIGYPQSEFRADYSYDDLARTTQVYAGETVFDPYGQFGYRFDDGMESMAHLGLDGNHRVAQSFIMHGDEGRLARKLARSDVLGAIGVHPVVLDIGYRYDRYGNLVRLDLTAGPLHICVRNYP